MVLVCFDLTVATMATVASRKGTPPRFAFVARTRRNRLHFENEIHYNFSQSGLPLIVVVSLTSI